MSPNVMNTFTVGYFIGSLSSQSINRLLSKALVRLAPSDLRMVEIPFRDLPLYSPDLRSGLSTRGSSAQGRDQGG